MVKSWLLLSCVLLLAIQASAQSPATQPSAAGQPPKPRAQLEKELQQTLTNVELVGTFRMTGNLRERQPLGPPSEEKYTIVSAGPDSDDYWIFTARVQYGEHDVQLPMRLKVLWAGDTPIVTVDQVTFPGLGTYSARVMFYGGYYSGTWFGANCGGILAGEIRKLDQQAQPTSAPARP